MAGDPYKTVAAFQPLRISAPAWNELMSMARERKARALSGRGGLDDSGLNRQTCAYVRNDSDTDAPMNGILELDGVAISPDDNEPSFRDSPTFKGKKPADATAPFCITLEPIPAGKCGRALFCGLSAVRLDVADTDHGFAVPSAGNVAGLVSAATGPARILFAAGGTGVQWAVVSIGGAAAEVSAYPFKVWTASVNGAWYWCVSRSTPPAYGGTWGAQKAGRVTLMPFGYDTELNVVPWTVLDQAKTKLYLKAAADGSTCLISNEAPRSSLVDDTGAKTLFYIPLATLAYANNVLTVSDEIHANVAVGLPVWV